MGGDMHILLDEADVDSIRRHGFCEARTGLAAHYSKTLVKQEDSMADAVAELCDSDLTIFLPTPARLPFEVSREAIMPLDCDESRLRFYFGETGRIILSAT